MKYFLILALLMGMDEKRSANAIYIADTKNMGFFTSAPTEKLHINGSTLVVGNLSLNGTLKVTASDNSSQWMCLNITQAGLVGAYKC
jgi:hypothetical protein